MRTQNSRSLCVHCYLLSVHKTLVFPTLQVRKQLHGRLGCSWHSQPARSGSSALAPSGIPARRERRRQPSSTCSLQPMLALVLRSGSALCPVVSEIRRSCEPVGGAQGGGPAPGLLSLGVGVPSSPGPLVFHGWAAVKFLQSAWAHCCLLVLIFWYGA